jgi:succinate dehydrogenase/fumarate reductase-like Fe-S protein
MNQEVIEARIFRFSPLTDKKPSYQVFMVPCERPTPAYWILRKIYEDIDRTLAFRAHRCGHGVCLGCLIKLNGKIVKGCETLVAPGAKVTIEPVNADKIVRDLVVTS